MKKLSILLIALAFLTSCTDFLEEEQVTQQSYGYYDTEAGCEALVNACYQSLRTKVGNEWAYGLFNYGADEYMKGYEWTQPYAMPEYNDYSADLDGHDRESPYEDIFDWWELVYKGIDRCNVAVDKIDRLEGALGLLADAEGRNQRLAEVRFIRAWHYFTLVQQFGAIPVSMEPTSEAKYEWPKVPASEVYNIIINDLSFAYEHIPETQSDLGRVTKDAVRHYWAKVLLTRASNVTESGDDPDVYDLGGDPTADLQKCTQLIEEIHEGGRHALVTDYKDLFAQDNQVNDEVIFSIQYNTVSTLNEGNGSYYKNSLHLYWLMQNDVDPGMQRKVLYGRPFRRLMITDYAIDIHDRLNDSRLRKSLLEVHYATLTDESTPYPAWTANELLFAFDDVAPDGSWAIRYGDTIHVGDVKFGQASAGEGEGDVNVGDTALVFLVNDESTTLTDRQIVAAGYNLYARYYWSTNADGSLNELITYDRNNNLLQNIDSERPVEGYDDVLVSTWNRNKAPSLIKFWDTERADYQDAWGTRDVIVARLAESYLIAAEAYGRLNNYTKAVEFINYLRERAAYKDGEEKPGFWVKYDGGTMADLTSSTVDNMLIDESYWDNPANDERELYPEGVNSKEDKFIHFILNERSREMLGEMKRWEDLKRTGTLLQRAYAFNADVANSATLQKFHRVRPFPITHLNTIKQDGNFLTPAQKQAYQNEGYY